MRDISRKIGQVFQTSIENSCDENGIFFHNIKDVNIPFQYRKQIRIPKNKFDSFLYYKGHLFAVELKTTNKKSLSLAESVVKAHQIENLEKASKFEGVKAGLLVNFREQPENLTYFIPIDKLTEYMEYAKTPKEHPYKCRQGRQINRSSIPIDVCKEIGVELHSELKRVHYRYAVKELLEEIISFH